MICFVVGLLRNAQIMCVVKFTWLVLCLISWLVLLLVCSEMPKPMCCSMHVLRFVVGFVAGFVVGLLRNVSNPFFVQLV